MRAIVVGAGVSGLGAALLLARDGHDVVLFERDATPLPADPDEAFHWDRRGAPQVRHSHAFLARGRNLLRDRLPEVRDALLGAGVREVGVDDLLPETVTDRSPRPGDEDLVMLACRRTTFEWTLRKIALETHGVDLRDGVGVTGLVLDGSHVTGVRTDAGDESADLVIDATGRPSRLVSMLDIGEDRSDTGIVYLSRFYRLRGEAPNRFPFMGADLGYLKFAVFRGDNDTFSITFAHGTDDDELRMLREPARFDAATMLIDMARIWADPDVSEPISDLHYMGGLINRVRHFVVDGTPVVTGLVAVGDSSVCTNPLYGRGCSLGLVHGALLADLLREHDDPRELALAFDDATKRELVPWYEASVMQDAVNVKVARGEPLSATDEYVRSVVTDGIFYLARTDADVSRAWTRSFNLLTPPYTLLTDQTIMPRVIEAWNEREQREPEPLPGPERGAFLEAVHS
jgi:2-polyprenyl-6-methoxyphenol hydroxylase-like FAD-dependent oxidoreductase